MTISGFLLRLTVQTVFNAVCIRHCVNDHFAIAAVSVVQGPRRVKKSGGSTHTPMASAGARACNVGLGAPAVIQGAEPPVEGQGAKPPAADDVFVFKTIILNVSATVLHEMMYCLTCFFCKVSK